MRPLLVLPLVAVLLSPASTPAFAAEGCADGRPPAWFVGVVYDEERRRDFVLDITNFEDVAEDLGAAHCIPEENVTILAMDEDYTLDGTTYPAATPSATIQAIRAAGEASAGVPGATVFFFLSSHGIAQARYRCPGGTRQLGSVAFLAPDHRNTFGEFTDCDLGTALNEHVDPAVKVAVFVDCSLCGGFSDSITPVSGTTLPDGSVPVPSGILGPNRVVVTGCAVLTECTGSAQGGRLYRDLMRTMSAPACDGWTTPGFPDADGVNLPVRNGPRDGRCTVSEWLFAAVDASYRALDPIAIQQQYRLKFGFASLDDDIPVA